MTSERHAQIKELFLAACERPAEERSAFLGRVCGEDEELRREVESLARHAARWLARRGVSARTVTLKLRYDDFSTVTRSDSRGVPRRDEADLVARAQALLARTDAGARPVRLVGVTVSNLFGPGTDHPDIAANDRVLFPQD